jgi:predicted aspartyl protease
MPSLDERANLYLRAVHGRRDFGHEAYSEARNRIVDAMAADVAKKLGFNLPEPPPIDLASQGDSPKVEPESEDFGEDSGPIPAFTVPSRASLKSSLRMLGPLSITICVVAAVSVGAGTVALIRNNDSASSLAWLDKHAPPPQFNAEELQKQANREDGVDSSQTRRSAPARQPNTKELQKQAKRWEGAELPLAAAPPAARGSLPLTVPVNVTLITDGGGYKVPVQINGDLTLNFIIDSGAADVLIPADIFSALMRNGTIRDSDITGKQPFLADASEPKSFTFIIRSLKVGGIVIDNVKGRVAPQAGSLLLGQSFLERFKSWSIDNTKHVLLLEPQ